MIGKLTGYVDEIEQDHILLDVGGVGYIVYCAVAALGNPLCAGDKLSLYIFSYLREDVHKLYGFLSKEERHCFTLLRNVPKVGPKHAMALLSYFSLERLSHIIASKDVTSLTKAPGIGRTLAEKIIHELKNKVFPLSGSLPAGDHLPSLSHRGSSAGTGFYAEVISGLVNLGYSSEQAMSALESVLEDKNFDNTIHDTPTLLRLALKACGGVN